MAVRLNAILTITHLPAFYDLLAAAASIAEVEGEDRAIEWAKRVLEADIGLFCAVVRTPIRPQLRLIDGGAA